EALREVGVALLDVGLRGGGEEIELAPDAGAGEAVDDRDAELLRGPAGVDQPFGGALADALGVAVAADGRGDDRLVPLVDRVADALTDQVDVNGPALLTVLVERRLDVLHIGV